MIIAKIQASKVKSIEYGVRLVQTGTSSWVEAYVISPKEIEVPEGVYDYFNLTVVEERQETTTLGVMLEDITSVTAFYLDDKLNELEEKGMILANTIARLITKG